MTRPPNRPRPPHAWYALRRTLPPWRFDENLDELIRRLPEYRVDEVIVKVDTEEFSHGQLPLSWLRAYQPNLFRLRRAMEKIGVVYSLNPWITLCHCDRGRDSRRTVPGIRMMVGHDGVRCKACACPLSAAWRKYVAKLWRLYAETGPHIIWVEDDIRTFNHEPVKFGCFCPDHLRLFAKRVGENVTREQLVAAMLKPGRPHPWRAAYLDMQGEIMIDVVAHLSRSVHAVDPDVCLGLMSSGHHYHGVEGRRWHDFAHALADGRPLYSRPPLANYAEEAMRGLYYSQDSVKGTRHVLPAGTMDQTEVENFPFSGYANSTTFTFLKMAVSFAYGSRGVTLNLFDHCGIPMDEDPSVGRMLGERKRFLDSLAGACQAPGVYRGVQLLHHPEEACHTRLPAGADYDDLAPDPQACMEQLEAHGVPTTYDPEHVVATAGQTLRAFTDDQVRGMLSAGRGLLLDATAARVLFDRGFGPQIGLKAIGHPRPLDALGPFGAEELIDPAFGGADGTYLTLICGVAGRPRVGVMEAMRGARVVSRAVDPDRKRHHPLVVAYENRWGGRVVVQAFDLAAAYSVGYCCPLRARLLQSVVQWLARGQAPLLARGEGAWPLAFRKDCGNQTVLGLFNLTLDDWPRVAFDLDASRAIGRVRMLGPTGRWRTAKAAAARLSKRRLFVDYLAPVSHRLPLVLRLDWRGVGQSSSNDQVNQPP